MNAGKKLETLEAMRAEIRALTYEQREALPVGRAFVKSDRARRIEHKRRDRARAGFES